MDLNSPIIPGKAAAGIELSQNIRDVLAVHKPDSIRQQRTHDCFTFGPVRLHASKETGVLLEICVGKGYTGTTPEGIRIGTPLGIIEKDVGTVSEHEDGALQIDGIAGLVFETTPFDGADLNTRLVTHLFVFPEADFRD